MVGLACQTLNIWQVINEDNGGLFFERRRSNGADQRGLGQFF